VASSSDSPALEEPKRQLQQLAWWPTSEQASAVEALTAILGQEIEMANKYRVLANGKGPEIFFAAEHSGSQRTRLCWTAYRGC